MCSSICLSFAIVFTETLRFYADAIILCTVLNYSCLADFFSAPNAPDVVWRPSSAQTLNGELKRSPRSLCRGRGGVGIKQGGGEREGR